MVHHASGIVSEQLDIDVDQALLRLRAFAFATGRRVVDVAREVVDGRLRIESWLDNARRDQPQEPGSGDRGRLRVSVRHLVEDFDLIEFLHGEIAVC